MHIEEYRTYCLAKQGVTESFPFDENVLVFKVLTKMFALCNINKEEFAVNLKCEPERAIELRASHPDIIAGYHMNKKHWNTVSFDGELSDKLLFELIDHSYDLVVQSLTKSQKALLNAS